MGKKPTDQIYRKTREPLIGGPGTLIPWPVESFMGWMLAISCLSISGYHYIVATIIKPIFARLELLRDEATPEFPVWLPLVTHSREEADSKTPLERHDQLVRYLDKTTKKAGNWTNDELVRIVRDSEIARRLVSLAMRPSSETPIPMGKQLGEIWKGLLLLPPAPNPESFPFEISMILPAYRERGTDIRAKLTRAMRTCKEPNKVQVVVINAGECIDLRECIGTMEGWGELKIVDFTTGGGRGPCLNFGTRHASGRLYSFCHSDTTLPPDWDAKVIRALDERPNGIRANSCAFSFGIDTSETGLNGGPYPPGIRAVETTANIRTQLYSLPYGDQVLSVPAVVFHHLGGYPEQCLMEDYELISLLRRRAALLPKFGIRDRERLVIIGGIPALCSPRRWQKFGVLYVTFMNSKLVNLYAGGLGPNALFELYYGRPSPKKADIRSPWEAELDDVVSGK